ncbi:MAG: DUF2807 domain-containing protein [Muribaculaceae bacterium]|nr:DUF2807 domain-containing protein [Muribaculaceae bacterium]
MNRLNTTLAIIAALCITSAAQAQEKEYKIEVGNFCELSVTDNLSVEYLFSTDSAGYAVFTTNPDLAHAIVLSNSTKGKLTLRLSDDNLKNSKLPVITLYSTELLQVTNEGKGDVNIRQLRPVSKFTAKTFDNGSITVNGLDAEEASLNILTGKGNITVSGTCEKLECKNVGKGVIEARNLEAHSINCSIVGTGHIYCNSTGGPLVLKGTGSGKVHYKGTPSSIKLRQLGSLKALPITDED